MKQFQIIYSIQMTLPFVNGHDVSSADDSDKKVDNEIDRLKEQLELTPKKSNESSHNSTLVIDLPNSTGKF